MCENEPLSLEYIEDPYIPKLDNCVTPSLDEITEFDQRTNCDWPEETELYLRSLTLDQIFYDSIDYDSQELQAVETNFGPKVPNETIAKRWRLKLFTKKSMRDVKVTFVDFSKPYIAKISKGENYKRFLNIGNSDNSTKMSEPASPASVASADIAAEFASLTAEEQVKRREEWSRELMIVEEEINTLRTVLASKIRHESYIKRKLGITVWDEIANDMNQGLKNVKESQVYQKTGSVIKTTAEKTSSIFGGITSGITSKISQIKNSESMRSLEDKVGSAYENVKTKVGSRSGSVSSFSDALNENHSDTTPTSPTIPEGKTNFP